MPVTTIAGSSRACIAATSGHWCGGGAGTRTTAAISVVDFSIGISHLT